MLMFQIIIDINSLLNKLIILNLQNHRIFEFTYDHFNDILQLDIINQISSKSLAHISDNLQ